jgi:hypothetical protein
MGSVGDIWADISAKYDSSGVAEAVAGFQAVEVSATSLGTEISTQFAAISASSSEMGAYVSSLAPEFTALGEAAARLGVGLSEIGVAEASVAVEGEALIEIFAADAVAIRGFQEGTLGAAASLEVFGAAAGVGVEAEAIFAGMSANLERLTVAFTETGVAASGMAAGVKVAEESIVEMEVVSTGAGKAAVTGFTGAAVATEAFGKEVEKTETKLRTMQIGLIALPGLVIGGLGLYAAHQASEFQDEIVTLQTLMTTGDEAEQHFQWMKTFAIKTPFTTDELVNADIQLKNIGIDGTQSIESIADAASARGRTVGEATTAFASAIAGYPRALRDYGIYAYQINKSNFDKLQALTNETLQMGETAYIYLDQQGQTHVQQADKFNKQATASTIEMIFNEKYAGAVQARSQTLSGLWSTLTDDIQIAMSEMSGMKLDKVDELEVSSLSLLNVFQLLENGAIRLATGFLNLSPSTKVLIGDVVLGVGAVSLMTAGFLAWGAILPVITGETLVCGMSFTALAASVSAAVWPATLTVGAIGLIVAGLILLDEKTGLVSKTLDFLSDSITVLADGFSGLWDSFTSDLGDLTTDLGELYDAGMKIAQDWHLDDVFSFIWDLSPLKLAVDLLTDIGDLLGGFVGDVGTKADEIRAKHEDAAKNSEKAWTDAANNSGKSWDPSNSGFGTSQDNMASSSSTNSEKSKGFWSGIVGDITSAWDPSTSGFTETQDGMATEAETAAGRAKTAWDKALEEMMETQNNIQTSNIQGVENASPALSNQLAKGIQGTGKVMGLDNSGQLVIQSYDGQIQKLNELNATQDFVFKGINKNYAIIIDDGTRSQEQLDNEAIGFRKMGDEVIVVKKHLEDMTAGMDLANNLSFDNLHGNLATTLRGLKDGTIQGYSYEETMKGLNGVSLSGVNGNVTNLRTNITNSNTSTGTLRTGLNNVNAAPMSTVQGNVSTVGKNASDSNISVGGLRTGISNVNSAPMSTIHGNVATVGKNATESNTQVGGLRTGIGNVNNTSLSTIHGNVTTVGSRASSSNILVGGLRTGITNVNITPLSTVHGNITTIGTRASTSSGNVSTLHNWIAGLNNISLSSIQSKLSGIISSAQSAISYVERAAGLSSSSSSSRSSSSSTVNNVKIATVNNNGTSISQKAMRLITYGGV